MPTPQWAARLASLVVNALSEFSGQAKGQIEAFAVDCHPWHGDLGLSMLTHDEVVSDLAIFAPAEMAAWQYFDFGSNLTSWQAAADLGSQMREAYYNSDDHAGVAEEYLRACADAIATPAVQQAISKYKLTNTFRIFVCHPDTDKQYYHSK